MNNTFLIAKPSFANKKFYTEIESLISGLVDIGASLIILDMKGFENTDQLLFLGHWIMFHGNDVVSVFPLSSLDRQKERNDRVFDLLDRKNVHVENVVDFTEAETEGVFLEGSGSVVVDKDNETAYLSVSTCSDEQLFIEFCEELEYTPIVFNARFSNMDVVLHTENILFVAVDFALLASSMIQDKKERKLVATHLKKTGREIIYITEEQVVANVAQIKMLDDRLGNKMILMTESVHAALHVSQINSLEKYGRIKLFNLNSVEQYGNNSLGALLIDVY